MDNANIWLKELELSDGREYCSLLIELASYDDVYARPVPRDFSYDDFDAFKAARVMMATGENLPSNVVPTSTYWVMDGDVVVGYATLKHRTDENTPGGHFGLCLRKDCQNNGIGMIVSDKLSIIAYDDFGIENVIYTANSDNSQSKRSIEKIGGELISIHDGYHFYGVDLTKKIDEIRRRRVK